MESRREPGIELLGQLMLFESCTKKELGQIASIMVEAERPAGTFLTREGKDGGLMFIIVDGTADVVAGNGQVLGKLKAGDVVGELSLIDGKVRSASVVASSPVQLLEIVADDFKQLVQRSPKFVHALLRSLSLRVRQMDTLSS